MGQKQSVENVIIDMKIKSKEMKFLSEKCTKEERTEKLKVKKALENNNFETARLFAETAIRKKNESLNCLRLSSKMDAVATRLETSSRSKQMNNTLTQAVPLLSKMMAKFDTEKLGSTMTAFEQIFMDLDLQNQYINNSVDVTVASTTPQVEVDELISRVAEEHALDVSSLMPSISNSPISTKTPVDMQTRMHQL